MKKGRTTGWGEVASEYGEAFTHSPDSYHAKVILPNLLRLITPAKGKQILEIGCGDGYFASAFVKEGANVVGSDIATEMIEAAKQRDSTVKWHVASADNLSFAKSASFDAAIIVLALQNIENFNGAIVEAARVLRAGGELFIVLNHPAFRIPKRSSWGWDNDANVQYRRMDGYMSESREKIDMDPGSNGGKRFTTSFHRPLQVYAKALTKNGFAITGVEEWISHKESEKGPRADAENTARKEFPMFMMVRAKKQLD